MSFLSELFKSSQFDRMATMAYVSLVQYHNTTAMKNLCEYMEGMGLQYDASHNQLTFWMRSSRSPKRERIIVDMPGIQDQMIPKCATSVKYTAHYIAYFLDEAAVGCLHRELENAPDKMADARAILKDRANEQDPALRGGTFSIDIAP